MVLTMLMLQAALVIAGSQRDTKEEEKPLIDSLDGTGLSAEHQALVDAVHEAHQVTLKKQLQKEEHKKENANYTNDYKLLCVKKSCNLVDVFCALQVADLCTHIFTGKGFSATEQVGLFFGLYGQCKFRKLSLSLQALASGESKSARYNRLKQENKNLEQEYIDAQERTKRQLQSLRQALECHASEINFEPQGLISQEKADYAQEKMQESIKYMSKSCAVNTYHERCLSYECCSDAINHHIRYSLKKLQEARHTSAALLVLHEAPCIDTLDYAATNTACKAFMERLDNQARILFWDYYYKRSSRVNDLRKSLHSSVAYLALNISSSRFCPKEAAPSWLLEKAFAYRNSSGIEEDNTLETFKQLVIACDTTMVKNDNIRKDIERAQLYNKKLAVAEKDVQDINLYSRSIGNHNRQELIKLSEHLDRKVQQDSTLTTGQITVLKDHAEKMHDACRTNNISCEQSIKDYLEIMKETTSFVA